MKRGSKSAWTGIHAALLNEDHQGGQHQEKRLYVKEATVHEDDMKR